MTIRYSRLKHYNNFKIYISDVEDNYKTVVFKLVSAFKWISDASKYNGNNLKWILKIDDDVLLGIQELEKFIKNIPQEDSNAIFCKIKPHDPTIRGKFKG